jgi:hypothetical protein
MATAGLPGFLTSLLAFGSLPPKKELRNPSRFADYDVSSPATPELPQLLNS